MADSTQPVIVDSIVIRSTRIDAAQAILPEAVSRIDPDPDRNPAKPLTDYIDELPGIRTWSPGNRWGRSSVDVRGFYGGGQSDYLLASYGGITLNDIGTGLIDWATMGSGQVGYIESVLGPVSSERGDYAFGGYIALTPLTDAEVHPRVRLSTTIASDQGYLVNAQASNLLAFGPINATLEAAQNDGWREHSQFEARRANLVGDFSISEDLSLAPIIQLSSVREEVPGAISAETLREDRTRALSITESKTIEDYRDGETMLAGVNSTWSISTSTGLKTSLSIHLSSHERVQTIITPLYSEPSSSRLSLESSVNGHFKLGSWSGRWNAGAGYEHAQSSVSYREYENGSAGDGNPVSGGTGKRGSVNGFGHLMLSHANGLSVAAGIRYDNIRTSFEPDKNTIVTIANADDNSEDALSGNLGMSYVLDSRASVFVSVSRAFKAPTLLHLYDSPPYPLPPEYGGGYTSISNANLESQTGTCWEAGIKSFAPNLIRGRVSAYYYSIEDEIDFYMSTLSYANIGESRHYGMEVTWHPMMTDWLISEVNVNTNIATFDSGESKGNRINGVPEMDWNLQLGYTSDENFRCDLTFHGLGKQYLDAANTQYLTHRTRADFGVQFFADPIQVRLDIENITDEKHCWDAFIGLGGQARYYPAPGRSLSIGASLNL